MQAIQQIAGNVLYILIDLNKHCYGDHHKNASDHRKNLNFHLQFPNPKKQLLDKRALMISYW